MIKNTQHKAINEVKLSLMDVDFELMILEDHMHGNDGDVITKLRNKVREILKN